MHAVHETRPYDCDFGMPFAIVAAALALGLASPLAATAQPGPGQPVAAANPDGADPAAGETDFEAPNDQAPNDRTPTDQTPTDQTPTDRTPTDQTPTDRTPTDQTPTDQTPTDEPPTDEPPTFLDAVTVSATLRPAPVRDTPGVVSVIDGETIQERMVEDFADLVKYEPGVYVENNVTRLGLNGFNIRGIGGNRVMTLVDGVQTSEQFDFGPFNVHQAGLDVDVLKTVEIVRSANSSLYGSDALGGVVSLFTKDPADYLQDQRFYLGGKTTWDSRADAVGANLTLAAGGERVQVSAFTSLDRGGAIGNQGAVEAGDHTRTAPNPQDVDGRQVLAKLVYSASPDNRWRVAGERYDSRVETDWLSNNRLLDFGRFAYLIEESAALDTQRRQRLSLDHTLVGRGLDLFSWRVYGQRNDTAQVLDEARMTTGFGAPFSSTRHGTVDYEQAGYGGSAQGQHWLGGSDDGMLITFGGSYKTDYFDMRRDRTETDLATGRAVPTDLIFPTKYFPESDVVEAGAYLQGELRFGRFTLVPGARYDHFSLDANQADPVFVASLNPRAADYADGALSPKIGLAARLTDVVTLHAQYAGGFRAPPYSAINTGFASPSEGYTTLPNPDLRAETSDNLEIGVRTAFDRASLGVSAFSNRYADFIELTDLGVNALTGLLEFQSRNLEAARIDGVEVFGEAYLTDSLMVRGSYARIEGQEFLRGAAAAAPIVQETPLGSVAPDEAVVGLRYVPRAGRWGSELSVRLVEAYRRQSVSQFAPAAYRVVDWVGFVALTEAVRLRLGLLNLTDATYFEWWNVRGRQANDPVIDRYSSPGVSLITSLAFDW